MMSDNGWKTDIQTKPARPTAPSSMYGVSLFPRSFAHGDDDQSDPRCSEANSNDYQETRRHCGRAPKKHQRDLRKGQASDKSDTQGGIGDPANQQQGPSGEA